MVFNGLSFAEAPLQSLIKRFRMECERFEKVETAADEFLKYLNKFGSASSEKVKDRSILRVVDPVLRRIQSRFQEEVQSRLFKLEGSEAPDPKVLIKSSLDHVISTVERGYSSAGDAQFIGEGPLEFPVHVDELLTGIVSNQMKVADADQQARIVAIAKLVLKKDVFSDGFTGIVIAGFGEKELFPTLVSFEIDGMVGDRLKYKRTNYVDIDRDGVKSRVIPFAQKEMVDRFLYGLDDGIEGSITSFCRQTVPDIRKALLETIEFADEDDAKAIEQDVIAAEEVFIEGLGKKAFAEIRTQSQAAIDSMIEFMPKPELAKMAEALVNLTSIKKRVSRGMETVGGPIDVALISQAEGFVWVKRKHYFPAELNPRYFQRVQSQVPTSQEPSNDAKSNQAGGSRTRRGKAEKEPSGGGVGGA
jgi:hypothetical protein